MSEPVPGFVQPPRYWPELRLTLDPQVECAAREAEQILRARQMIQKWLQPDFPLLLPQWGAIIGTASSPLSGQRSPPFPLPAGYTRGAGPTPPKPADLADVAKAIYRLPPTQKLVEQAHDQLMHDLRHLLDDWNEGPNRDRGTGKAGNGVPSGEHATTAERIAMVSITGVVVGPLIAGVATQPAARQFAYQFLKDKDIPAPGVDGLSFKFTPGGAGTTVPIPGLPGVGVSGQIRKVTTPAGRLPDHSVTISVDVMKFLKLK